MNFAKKILFAALLVLATSLTAAAQDRVIKFKLDRATHIGSSIVQAGEYRMAVSSDPFTMAIVAPADRAGTALIALPVARESGTCSTPSVTLAPLGSELALTAVCFGESEMALQFRTVRGAKEVATQPTDAAALAGAR